MEEVDHDPRTSESVVGGEAVEEELEPVAAALPVKWYR